MKRVFDFVVAGSLLLLALPVMIVIAVLVRLRLGSPVLFRQKRPGLRGKIFELTKFRTMRDAVGKDGQPLPDHVRLTPLGRSLRASSLDELPQLINVLRGDMSLVGPRPLLPEYLPFYTATQARRHDVRPGITGWAQVNGRNAISWDEKFALDVWYVDNQSFALDMRILAKTFRRVLVKDGINSAENVTMARFDQEQISKSKAE